MKYTSLLETDKSCTRTKLRCSPFLCTRIVLAWFIYISCDDNRPHINAFWHPQFSHNIFFKTRTRSKARNLIQLPETERKATILDRRTIPQHQQRFSGFRTRKRIPLKFGRSFRDGEDDKPSDQLIRLRNSEIITKLERSGHNERQVIKTRDKSRDDLDDKMSVKQPEDDPRHVTPDQEEKSRVEQSRTE